MSVWVALLVLDAQQLERHARALRRGAPTPSPGRALLVGAWALQQLGLQLGIVHALGRRPGQTMLGRSGKVSLHGAPAQALDRCDFTWAQAAGMAQA